MLSLMPSYFSLSSKTMIALLNILMPVVVNRSMSWKNRLMFEAFIFVIIFKYITVKGFSCFTSVQLFQFFKSPSLRSWMLGLLLSVLALINFLLFSLLRTGTLRAHSCYFLLLRKIYDFYNSYKARGAIKLFQLDELF